MDSKQCPPSSIEVNPPHENSKSPPRFSPELPRPPVLTSYEAGWDGASLEYYDQPPGETPQLCLDHYAIAICMVQDFELEHQMDGVAKGRLQKDVYFKGGATLIPMQHSYWGRWQQPIEAFMLNLKPELLTRSAEGLEVDQVELLPRMLLDDPLIVQIALALKADLESHKSGGRLYAETMMNALAVHLLRNHSAHRPKSIRCPGGGLSSTQLNPVIDYIHDALDRELSLEELAAVAQLSPYYFCRAFKQSIGLTPHQYVMQQRVERAKLLLKDGKMKIPEVAIACGFTHQSHLNRHFKRLTGVTPKFFSRS